MSPSRRPPTLSIAVVRAWTDPDFLARLLAAPRPVFAGAKLRRFHRAYAFSRNSQPFGKNRLRAWTELCECVHRAGCRKLVLLSSHGGNNAVLETIAHDLRARLDMLVVIATWRRFGAPDGLFSSHELTHGIHGGEVETSLMLAFRPSLVRLEEAEEFLVHGNHWQELR